MAGFLDRESRILGGDVRGQKPPNVGIFLLKRFAEENIEHGEIVVESTSDDEAQRGVSRSDVE
jgi:hypothetical protein